jgi:hypothetical protein
VRRQKELTQIQTGVKIKDTDKGRDKVKAATGDGVDEDRKEADSHRRRGRE